MYFSSHAAHSSYRFARASFAWDGTLAERVTRYTIIRKNYHKTSAHTLQAIERAMAALPPNAMHSVTFDNGNEFARHTSLRKKGIETYFCGPGASWQKGTIENTNGRVRRFLPRKTIIKQTFTIQTVEKILNNTPRKCLKYATPKEEIQRYLPDFNLNHILNKNHNRCISD